MSISKTPRREPTEAEKKVMKEFSTPVPPKPKPVELGPKVRCPQCNKNHDSNALLHIRQPGIDLFFVCPSCGVPFIPKVKLKSLVEYVQNKARLEARLNQAGIKMAPPQKKEEPNGKTIRQEPEEKDEGEDSGAEEETEG